MAFKNRSCSVASTPPIEYYLGTDAEAFVLGEAVVTTSGRLTKCAADACAEFITLAAQAAETTAVTLIPVQRIREIDEYETTMGAVNGTPAAIALGSLLTLHTDGATLSYVTTNGDFYVTGLSNTGNAVVGDKVRGYFRR